jgi:hypothetical protein
MAPCGSSSCGTHAMASQPTRTRDGYVTRRPSSRRATASHELPCSECRALRCAIRAPSTGAWSWSSPTRRRRTPSCAGHPVRSSWPTCGCSARAPPSSCFPKRRHDPPNILIAGATGLAFMEFARGEAARAAGGRRRQPLLRHLRRARVHHRDLPRLRQEPRLRRIRAQVARGGDRETAGLPPRARQATHEPRAHRRTDRLLGFTARRDLHPPPRADHPRHRPWTRLRHRHARPTSSARSPSAS